MDSEFGDNNKVGVVAAIIFAAIIFVFILFQSPDAQTGVEVKGEIVEFFAVARSKESNKFIRVLLEDGTEVNAKVNKLYPGMEGKKVILLKKTGMTTKYVFHKIVE